MGRQLKLLDYALACLWRRRGKSLAILAVYALTVGILASILLLTGALRREAATLLAEAPELVVQRTVAGRHDLMPLRHAAAIRAIPGVSAVTPRYWGYYFDPLSGVNLTLQAADAGLTALPLLDGRLPRPGECAIGRGVAATRGLGLDDELILIDSTTTGVSYTVVGLFTAPAELLTHDLVVLDRSDLSAFFGLPPEVATDLAVTVRNPRETATVATKISRLFPGARPLSRAEIVRTYDAVFNWRSGMLLTLFASALIAFCILAWDKATGLSAEERKEIGLLKALGWDTGDVLCLKLWEGLALSVTALLVGLLGAWVHVFLLDAPLLAAVLKGWSVLFPPFRLTPHIEPLQLLSLAFLTVAPYVASTVVPCWKAAVTDPDSVLRG